MPAMSATQMSWEEAVRWYRGQPGNEAAIRANYFDLPVHRWVADGTVLAVKYRGLGHIPAISLHLSGDQGQGHAGQM